MLKLNTTLLFTLLVFNLFSQSLPEVFSKSATAVNITELRDYYLNSYPNLSSCDSAAKQISYRLKSKNDTLFVLNELARIQLLSLAGTPTTAIDQLDRLKVHPLFISNHRIIGYHHNVYGNIYYHHEQPELALIHYQNSVNEFLQTKDMVGLKGNYINLGNAYNDEGKLDSAMHFYNQALLLEKNGTERFSQTLRGNIGQIHLRQNNLDSALFYYSQLVREYRLENNAYSLSNGLLNLGITFQKLEQIDSALVYLEECKNLCAKFQLGPQYKKTCVHLALCYQSKKQYELALEHFFTYDSALSIQYNEQLNQKIAEIDKKDIQNENLKEQLLSGMSLRKEQGKSSTYLMVITLLAFLLTLLLYHYLSIRNKKLKLVQLNLNSVENKKSNPPIDTNLIEQLENQLSNKIYTDSDLTLNKMAETINSNRTYLSKAINDHYQLSFSQLIHRYRIEEAKSMLTQQEYDHYSIEGIANSVGYKSTSNFNAVFKNQTGITPSYFRNQVKK